MTNSSTSIHKFWQPFDCFCIPKTDIHKYFISISKIRIFQTFGKKKKMSHCDKTMLLSNNFFRLILCMNGCMKKGTKQRHFRNKVKHAFKGERDYF